jgi:DNA end-binding protein Ku
MAARAIWKGVIRFGKTTLPVKLYSAVQDHQIRFRLLHRTDQVPVEQRLVNPATEKPVTSEEVLKAYPVTRTMMVILEDEDLAKLEPESSRDIEITRFIKPAELDARWYERPYYVGPDGEKGDYFGLAEALQKEDVEGIAHWVMRKKKYVGALRNENGYLMLIVLRYADEVISAEQVQPPEGRPLEKKEIKMAEQLVTALSGKFDPSEFRDGYRDRVMELIEAKARGRKVTVKKFRPRKAEESLDRALEASLAGIGKRRAAGGGR